MSKQRQMVIFKDDLVGFFDKIDDLGQHLVRKSAVVADDHYGDLGILPHVVVADFGDGDVELLANTGLKTLQGHPFRLQGIGFWKEQVKTEHADFHQDSPMATR